MFLSLQWAWVKLSSSNASPRQNQDQHRYPENSFSETLFLSLLASFGAELNRVSDR
jgi:hypothetical protein